MTPTTWTFTPRSGVVLSDANIIVDGEPYDVDQALIDGDGSIVTTDPDLAAALVALRVSDGLLFDVDNVPGEPDPGTVFLELLRGKLEDFEDGDLPSYDEDTRTFVPVAQSADSSILEPSSRRAERVPVWVEGLGRYSNRPLIRAPRAVQARRVEVHNLCPDPRGTNLGIWDGVTFGTEVEDLTHVTDGPTIDGVAVTDAVEFKWAAGATSGTKLGMIKAPLSAVSEGQVVAASMWAKLDDVTKNFSLALTVDLYDASHAGYLATTVNLIPSGLVVAGWQRLEGFAVALPSADDTLHPAFVGATIRVDGGDNGAALTLRVAAPSHDLDPALRSASAARDANCRYVDGGRLLASWDGTVDASASTGWGDEGAAPAAISQGFNDIVSTIESPLTVTPDRLAQLHAAQGSDTVRIPVSYASGVQDDPGDEPNFDAVAPWIDAYLAHGIRPIITAKACPGWMIPDAPEGSLADYPTIDDTDGIAAWGTLSAALVARWPTLRAFEGINEPNLLAQFNGDVELFCALSAAQRNAIRAVAPDMPYVTGGIVLGPTITGKIGNEEWSQGLYDYGLLPDDGSYFGVHPYSYLSGPVSSEQTVELLNDSRLVFAANDDEGRAMWATEAGISAYNPTSGPMPTEDQRASGLPLLRGLLSRQPDVAGVILHTLLVQHQQTDPYFLGFGVLDLDSWAPLSSAKALRAQLGALVGEDDLL